MAHAVMLIKKFFLVNACSVILQRMKFLMKTTLAHAVPILMSILLNVLSVNRMKSRQHTTTPFFAASRIDLLLVNALSVLVVLVSCPLWVKLWTLTPYNVAFAVTRIPMKSINAGVRDLIMKLMILLNLANAVPRRNSVLLNVGPASPGPLKSSLNSTH